MPTRSCGNSHNRWLQQCVVLKSHTISIWLCSLWLLQLSDQILSLKMSVFFLDGFAFTVTVFWGHVDHNSQGGIEHFISPAFCPLIISKIYFNIYCLVIYTKICTHHEPFICSLSCKYTKLFCCISLLIVVYTIYLEQMPKYIYKYWLHTYQKTCIAHTKIFVQTLYMW